MVHLGREEVVSLNAAQVLQDLIGVGYEELAPKHLDKSLVEEADPLLVACLVEDFVVNRPELVAKRLHHIRHERIESLASDDAVRADHEE